MNPNHEPTLPLPDGASNEYLPPELEEQVQALVEEYEKRLRAEEDPDLYEFLAAHVALAAYLGPRLEAVEDLHRLTQTRLLLGSTASTGEEDSPPDFIGRYRIKGILGRGASAVVYQAYDPKFDRWVALKVLREPAPSPDRTARFARDARILARLRHPNIVPLHDTGEREGLRYLDMELIEGESLEERLRGGATPYNLRQAAELVHRLALALDYAHEAGVVHRDVKPANVILDAQGEPQLTDFGLARHLDCEGTLTADGAIIGTPAYMSPEQADGRGREADRRSDVYSLGVILYRLLTGRLPFNTGDSVSALLLQIIHRNPPAPRAAVPAVPHDLETICLKALEKRPEDRFPTARAFADELGRWLHDEPLRIRRPTLTERLRRWARRNPPAAVFAGLAVLLLLVAAGILLGLTAAQRAYDSESQRRAQLEAETETLREKRDHLEKETNALQEKRLRMEEQSLLRAAWQRVRTPTCGQRFETLDLLLQVAKLRSGPATAAEDKETRFDIRSLFVAASAVPDIRIIREVRLPRCPFLIWPVALHPDGHEVVIGTQDGLIWWDAEQKLSVSTQLKTQEARQIRLAYSPDGRFLAFARPGGQLEVWDARTRSRLGDYCGDKGVAVLAVAFDSAGKTLWSCRANGQVESWSLPSLEKLQSWKAVAPSDTVYTAAAFNGDALLLAIGDKDGGIARYDRRGILLGTRDRCRAAIEALAWSPDNQRLAVGMRYGSVRLLDLRGMPHQDFAVVGPEVRHLLFSPDGRWLIAGARPQSCRVWDIATGAQILTSPFIPLGFARDSRCFVGARVDGAAVCELVRPDLMRPLRGHRDPVAWVTWSSNGQRLASMDSNFEIRVWDISRGLTQGVQVAVFQAPHGAYWAANAAVALSDDGRWLGYASGGKPAQTLLVDLQNFQKYGPWKLPQGFDRLVYASGRFLSIREEEQTESGEKWQTVARELTTDGLRVLSPLVRPPQPGEKEFFTSGVTPDGKYYWWAGPRSPVQAIRFEVREVATGKRLVCEPFPRKTEGAEIYGLVTPGGRYWIAGGNEPADYRVGDIAGSMPVRPVEYPAFAVSPDSVWGIRHGLRRPGRLSERALQTFPQGQVFLELPVGPPGDLSERSQRFSPDGRYLAWPGPGNALIVADLPALCAQVRAFEKSAGLH